MPVSGLQIRSASLNDGDAVFFLASELSPGVAHDRTLFEKAFRKMIADYPRAYFYVAEVQFQVVGYVVVTVNDLLFTNGPSAQLQEIVVGEKLRGNGVGTALVRTVEKTCEEAGVVQLTVASRRAGGFYDRLGYSQQAEFMRRSF